MGSRVFLGGRQADRLGPSPALARRGWSWCTCPEFSFYGLDCEAFRDIDWERS